MQRAVLAAHRLLRRTQQGLVRTQSTLQRQLVERPSSAVAAVDLIVIIQVVATARCRRHVRWCAVGGVGVGVETVVGQATDRQEEVGEERQRARRRRTQRERGRRISWCGCEQRREADGGAV
jgi:hypothetical protein